MRGRGDVGRSTRRPGRLVELDHTPVRGDQHRQRRHELGHRRPAEYVIGIAVEARTPFGADDRGRGMLGAPRVDHAPALARGPPSARSVPGRLPQRRLARPARDAPRRGCPCWPMRQPPAGPRHGARRPRLAHRAGDPPSRPRPSSRPARRATTATPRSPRTSRPWRRPTRHRLRLLDRQVLQGPRHLGGQDLGQRERRRGRTRSPVRRWHPRRRAHGVEMTLHILHWLVDGYGTDPRITAHRQQPRDLDRLPGQPGRRRVRHLRRPVPPLAQEPPADARARPSIGTDLNRNYSYRWGGGGRTSSEPADHHVPRPARVLRAGDAGDARLHRQPRRRWPPADPRRDHVPRERPARHVAVRLHRHGRAVRHDRPGPRCIRHVGPQDGRDQRVHASSRRATCMSTLGRPATTSTASTGSSGSRSSCRRTTSPIRTIR